MRPFKRMEWPKLQREEIIKRSKLLVIDDSDFFYLSLFKRDGYNIDKWDYVVDVGKLESGYYDIILLDIQGVGKEISPSQQGLGVLKHLKGNNPAQLIIAYSNADWRLKYQEFFALADSTLDKSQDYIEFKQDLRVSPDLIWFGHSQYVHPKGERDAIPEVFVGFVCGFLDRFPEAVLRSRTQQSSSV